MVRHKIDSKLLRVLNQCLIIDLKIVAPWDSISLLALVTSTLNSNDYSQAKSQSLPKDPNIVTSTQEEEDIAKGWVSHAFLRFIYTVLNVSDTAIYVIDFATNSMRNQWRVQSQTETRSVNNVLGYTFLA